MFAIHKFLFSFVVLISTLRFRVGQPAPSLLCRALSTKTPPRNGFADECNEIFDKVREIRSKDTPEFKPSELLLVERIATANCRPHWEKEILQNLQLWPTLKEKRLGIKRPQGSYVVVKNTPTMCRMLWRVKHLVRIKPVTFPNGYPEPGKFTGTYLDKSGEFRVVPELVVDEKLLEIPGELKRKQLTGEEIRKPLHLKWMNGL